MDNKKMGILNSGIVERIDAIRASMTGEEFKGFLKGNLEKYVMRYALNDEVEELERQGITWIC